LKASESFVEFIGEVGGRVKDEFWGNAYAMLFPIDWPEPFGLVMIESLACGTPVVGWRNGSVPEVIDDGITGFVVNNIDEAVDAVRRVQWLDRGTCRHVFEQRFDARRMAQDYLQIYRGLADGPMHAAGNNDEFLPESNSYLFDPDQEYMSFHTQDGSVPYAAL
jgi:glycosyltransferase involved in cell wall biosynthesis